MLSSHLDAEPKSRYVGSESTELRTLDRTAMDFVSENDHIFLKLDVQGFEERVLEGARELLPRVRESRSSFLSSRSMKVNDSFIPCSTTWRNADTRSGLCFQGLRILVPAACWTPCYSAAACNSPALF
jgi:hypothetical protein